jgi:hypothetical protein
VRPEAEPKTVEEDRTPVIPTVLASFIVYCDYNNVVAVNYTVKLAGKTLRRASHTCNDSDQLAVAFGTESDEQYSSLLTG